VGNAAGYFGLPGLEPKKRGTIAVLLQKGGGKTKTGKIKRLIDEKEKWKPEGRQTPRQTKQRSITSNI